jgi:hypothetical protein
MATSRLNAILQKQGEIIIAPGLQILYQPTVMKLLNEKIVLPLLAVCVLVPFQSIHAQSDPPPLQVGKDSAVVTAGEVPADVQKLIDRFVKGFAVGTIEKEVKGDGSETQYEATGKLNGQMIEVEIEFDGKGKFAEMEIKFIEKQRRKLWGGSDIPVNSIPPAVLKAVQAAAPGFEPKEAEKGTMNSQVGYEIEGALKDQSLKATFKVLGTGKILEIEYDVEK